jgi:hypothetical protein
MSGTHDSYDVFDTLIGRICYKGTDIFEIMEKYTGIPSFKDIRMNCETVGIDNIYNTIRHKYGISQDNLRDLELQLEYDFSFPILKYINAVKENDILISDMYLSEEQIKHLISKHRALGNKLYVTAGGKASGDIWNSDIVKSIQMHYGDNYISDYKNAINAGIPATHISNIDLTPIEKIMEPLCKEAAYIIRAVRLTTQTDTHFMNKMLHNLMLPIGTLVSYWIKNHVDSYNPDSIVFLSRDGYWLKCIFDALFPSHNTEYAYFSRIMANNQHSLEEFICRFKHKNCIFIDLFGTGGTFTTKSGPQLPSYRYLLPFYWKYTPCNNLYTLCSTNVPQMHNFISVETIFSAPHGSVIDERTLLNPEYNINELKSYIDGVSYFNKYSNIYTKYINLHKYLSDDMLRDAIYNIVSIGNTGEYNYIHNVLGIPLNCHSYNDRAFPIQYFSQIGQDKYYVEQVIKFRPYGTFIELGGFDGITGSNTYFLEKNLGWKGVVVECLPHLAAKCRERRTAAVYERAIYNESDKLVEITIPMGAEIEGGKEQLSGIAPFFRPESLACFSKSYEYSTSIMVPTITINDILQKEGLHIIDYMSVDIVGYELEALKSIDYDKYKIKYMTVEHATPTNQQNIYTFLTSKGYKLHRHNKWDDEYILE